MKNIKPKSLNESTVVEEVSLKELYEAAVKTEQQIINLTMAAVNFKDQRINDAAQALRSQAYDLSTIINQALKSGDLDAAIEDSSSALLEPAADASNMIEAVEKYPLEESKILQFIMKEFKLSKKSAQSIVEACEKSMSECNDMINEDDSSAVDLQDTDDADSVDIDLSEAYQMVNEGWKRSDFPIFHSKIVKALTESAQYENLKELVDGMKAASTPEMYECEMNKIYDYADEKGLKIKA